MAENRENLSPEQRERIRRRRRALLWVLGATVLLLLAIIGGDPHRLFEAPNVYQQVRLACPEFDVIGATCALDGRRSLPQ